MALKQSLDILILTVEYSIYIGVGEGMNDDDAGLL